MPSAEVRKVPAPLLTVPSVPETAVSCQRVIHSPRCEEMTLVSSLQIRLSLQVPSTCYDLRGPLPQNLA